MKTVYGEVGYKRTVYEKNNADGSKSFVYLLDETLELKNVGLISTNLAEKLAEGIKELSYRQCAAKVSEMTGQHISPMGVWKVIQALGEQVCEEEKEITRTHKEGHICGEKEVPVLFDVPGRIWEPRFLYLRKRREDLLRMESAPHTAEGIRRQ